MERLSACISGSFKFKPEIDQLHDEFADLGVDILEPSKGWLYIASQLPQPNGTFRPLPSERGLTHPEVEGRFLAAVQRSDFLYLHNYCHYLGAMASFEVRFARIINKPVFALEPLTADNFGYDLADYSYWSQQITVATPAEAARAVRETAEAKATR
jgi:hypothetical protein